MLYWKCFENFGGDLKGLRYFDFFLSSQISFQALSLFSTDLGLLNISPCLSGGGGGGGGGGRWDVKTDKQIISTTTINTEILTNTNTAILILPILN